MDYSLAFRLQFLSMEKHLTVLLLLLFRKHTGTQKPISLDFITVMSFYHLFKGNNNKDGFYSKVLD